MLKSIKNTASIPAYLLAASILLCGFLLLANEMMKGNTSQIDTAILMLLRDPNDPGNPIGPAWLYEAMRDISALGGIVVLSLITLFSFVYLLLTKHTGRALYLLLTIVSGTVMSNLLKHSFNRPRPNFAAADPAVFTASFPSGHSLMSCVVYISLCTLLVHRQADRNTRIYMKIITLFLTISVGFSRVYLGMHWPSDVLAGWLLGALWALLFWTAERLYVGRQ